MDSIHGQLGFVVRPYKNSRLDQAEVLKGTRVATAEHTIERRSERTAIQIRRHNGLRSECVADNSGLVEQVSVGHCILVVATGEVVGSWAIHDGRDGDVEVSLWPKDRSHSLLHVPIAHHGHLNCALGVRTHSVPAVYVAI